MILQKKMFFKNITFNSTIVSINIGQLVKGISVSITTMIQVENAEKSQKNQ